MKGFQPAARRCRATNMERRDFIGWAGLGFASAGLTQSKVLAPLSTAGEPGFLSRRTAKRVNDPLLCPKPLPAGGTIGIAAPASPATRRSDVLRGKAFWEAKGLRVQFSEQIFEQDGYLAGSIQSRAQALQSLFENEAVDAIQVVGGGYGSTQLIPHLDFDRIAKHPKPFIGRSDITSLHLALNRYCGMVTFYGPGLTSTCAPSGSEFTSEGLYRAMTSSKPLGVLPRHPEDAFVRTIAGGKASGRLLGGCLWPLCKSIGTPWAPDLRGAIFFFEETDEPPWSIDAHLTQLEQAGILDQVAGIVIGRMVNCEWSPSRPEYPTNLSLDEVLDRRLGRLGIPCLYGIPVGHENHTLTIPLGVRAILDASAGTLCIQESAFS
jgi:muramoyltetrapeptide carboxypeptidase